MARVTLVIDPAETVPWYRQWLDGACRGLDACRVEYAVATRVQIAGRALHDPDARYLLSRHTLYDLLDLLPDRSALLFEQEIHNPYTLAVADADATRAAHLHRATRLVTTCSAQMARSLAQTLPEDRSDLVRFFGFPYADQRLPDPAHRRAGARGAARGKTAVFPQAIRESNNPAFAVHLARRLIHLGWQVTFATPALIPDRYPVAAWRALGIAVCALDQHDLYALLTRAAIAVSTSSSGAVGIALYEAWRCGARPICPHGGWGDPPYFDPFSPTYPMWDEAAALRLIAGHEEVAVDPATYDPVSCVQRLLADL